METLELEKYNIKVTNLDDQLAAQFTFGNLRVWDGLIP